MRRMYSSISVCSQKDDCREGGKRDECCIDDKGNDVAVLRFSCAERYELAKAGGRDDPKDAPLCIGLFGGCADCSNLFSGLSLVDVVDKERFLVGSPKINGCADKFVLDFLRNSE